MVFCIVLFCCQILEKSSGFLYAFWTSVVLSLLHQCWFVTSLITNKQMVQVCLFLLLLLLLFCFIVWANPGKIFRLLCLHPVWFSFLHQCCRVFGHKLLFKCCWFFFFFFDFLFETCICYKREFSCAHFYNPFCLSV